MAALNNLRSGTVLPQEICGIICQDTDLTKYDLSALCSVSQVFRQEARRMLYSSVELNDKVQLKSFCISVLRRPHLVRGMRKLVLVMPPEMYVDPDDLSRIVKMLRLSTDLRDLSVLCDSSGMRGQAIQAWMLEGHVFKLTTFANSYFSYERMKKFLESQPEIETLQIVSQYSAGLDRTWMPNLKNLRCSISPISEYDMPSAIPIESNLERLQVSMSLYGHSWEVEKVAQWIKTRFRGTLKCLSMSLHMVWHGQDCWMEESIANVAKHLPDIKFLQIMDYTVSATPSPGSSPTSFSTTLFTQIETLILRPAMLRPDDPSGKPTISSWSDLQTDGGRLSVATRIMEAMPTLKWLVLVGSRNYEFNRMRSPTLELLEVQVDLDEDEWLKVRLLK